MTVADTARELRAVADRLGNMRPILEVKASDIRTYIDDRFNEARDVAGAPFSPLSETTIAINPRRAGGTPLSDTGRMRRSITTTVGARELAFGTNAVQAPALNFGNPRNRVFGGPPGPIPSRRFLPVSRDGRSLEPASFWDPLIADVEHWLATGEVR